ncbi:RNA polymerase sigma factor [Candidatus Peregrinibacteria bacterium]|jgi:RNA polymerase sigma-70 factor, ECF subfamily|nr:RNA polymerase sigma factor [Candidatus Peregrinibacteria bacterium]
MSVNKKHIESLVKKAQEGEAQAFGEIYDIYIEDIYRFVFYKVGQREIAEDLTEDSFLKAWEKLDTFEQTKHPFSSWLYRIAKNKVIDYFRKEKVSIEELNIDIADERMETKKSAEQYFNQKLLQKSLVHLPETQREVVVLRYVNELSHKEISEVVGKSEIAVRTLLSRGMAKLKELMKDLRESH